MIVTSVNDSMDVVEVCEAVNHSDDDFAAYIWSNGTILPIDAVKRAEGEIVRKRESQ